MILEKRTKEVDDSLRFEGGSEPSIWSGACCVTQESDSEIARCAKIVMKIQEMGGPVAVIGLGLGIMPRLLNRSDVYVWEIEPAIVSLFRTNHQDNKCCILANAWSSGASIGKYMAIVDDTGSSIQGLDEYLDEGGKIIT